MNWQSSYFFIKLRNVGRAMGVNKLIAKTLYGKNYEEIYDRRFSSQINSGDVVWDIGANVGYYTRMFAERVTDSGQVLAFEPSPSNFTRLQESCQNLGNVRLFPLGLGDKDDFVDFIQGEDDLGATSRVVFTPQASSVVKENCIQVPVRTGDGLIHEQDLPLPNVLKIDVEGFELEVIKGLSNSIESPALRLLGIEVHFRILKERGLETAPQWISKVLKESGFSTQWVDSSHLIAVRNTV